MTKCESDGTPSSRKGGIRGWFYWYSVKVKSGRHTVLQSDTKMKREETNDYYNSV